MRISSRTGFVAAALALSAVAGILAACGGTEAECRLGADCEGGQCSADGLCVVAGGGSSSGQTGASSGNASSSGNGGSSSGSSSSSGGSSTSSSSGSSGVGCVANLDGIITKEEVPQMAGLTGNFKFAADVDIDVAGVPAADGQFKWDFSMALEGDHDVTVVTKPVAGTWYASDFPTASYTALLGEEPAEAAGVLRVDPTSLSLLGLVSNSETEPATGVTNFQYDNPVTTLQFPLQVGATWTTANAAGNGSLAGLTVGSGGLYGTVSDTYEAKVDKRGALTTTYGIFPVLRIVTKFTREAQNLLLDTNSITVVFVTECGGTIAKVTSEKDAANGDFTHAVEVQRLSLPGAP